MDDGLDELWSKVEQFESTLALALHQKYLSMYPPEIADHVTSTNPITRWDLRSFLDKYSTSKLYPANRISRLIYQLFDIKLQLYYILEVDCGLYNHLVYGRGYDKSDPLKLPHILLTRFSLDQSLIGKSRVLWERMMNFVYYLETGEDIETKLSNRRSKKSAFFRFAASGPRWRFLEPYQATLERYDNAFRTPEYHQGSVLRVELLGTRKVDENDLLELVNKAINNFWDNLLSIVSGGKAFTFNELHMDHTGNIDPRYLA